MNKKILMVIDTVSPIVSDGSNNMNISNNNTTTEAGTDISPDMSTSDCCKKVNKGASKSNDNDGVCEVIGRLQYMSTDDNNIISVCANCGKEGDNVNNNCNKCKMVRYCNASCKKKHRHKHKKECEEHQRLATEKHNEELRIAAALHDIELFKQPPPLEDCPICFLRIPSLTTGYRHMSCCGKVICSGCIHAPQYDNQGNEVDNEKCPFCRTPTPYTDEEEMEREKKRIEMNDPIAMTNLGNYYRDGTNGFPQDYDKALEHYHRAGELGDARAYSAIGYAYHFGEGAEHDMKRAMHYYELAAIGGNEVARNNLGTWEKREGIKERALKHYMIAVRDGYANSLDLIKSMYTNGHATKEDYMKALQLYQTYLGEIKSDQRDKAAAADEDCRYY